MVFCNTWHVMASNPFVWLSTAPLLIASILALTGVVAVIHITYALLFTVIGVNLSMALMNRHLWYMKLWARVIKAKVAEIVDFQNRRKYVFFKGDACGTHLSSWSTLTNVPDLLLLPNGAVAPTCDASFVYLWRPTDQHDLVEQALSYDTVDWEEWAKLDHREKHQIRERMVSQLQVASDLA
jgi:hypothetical protein